MDKMYRRKCIIKKNYKTRDKWELPLFDKASTKTPYIIYPSLPDKLPQSLMTEHNNKHLRSHTLSAGQKFGGA